jgi:hypothetical protein
MHDMSHRALFTSIAGHARTVRHQHTVVRKVDAAIGQTGELDLDLIDFPIDVQGKPFFRVVTSGSTS